MAAPTLSVLSAPQFSQALDAALDQLQTLVRAAEICAAESHLTTCYWSDEHVSDCRQLATVHHLESGLEFCADHFRKVEKGEVIL